MIGLYAATQRNSGTALKSIRVGSFTLMYLGLWALTGVPVYFASVALGAISGGALAYVVAAVLVVAGIFQLSPLKRVCLRHCRSPLGFLFGHWREGWQGGLAMGRAHALYCLGCCWALMVVLVVAGAMSLAWVLLIAAIVAAEKLLPRGEWIARTTGIVLVLLGLAVVVRPELRDLVESEHPPDVAGAPRAPKATSEAYLMYVGRAAEGDREADAPCRPTARRRLMANVQWQISGDYCEACSCDSVCPCPTSGLGGTADQGVLRCRPRLPRRSRPVWEHPARRPELRRPAAHTGADDPGQLDGGTRPGRARVEGAARGAHAIAQRPGRRSDGGGGAADRHVRRGRGKTDPDSRERDAPVGSIPGMLDIAVEGIPAPARPSRSTSTTSAPGGARSRSRRPPGATCTPSGSTGTTRPANNGHFAPFAWSSS